MPTSVSIIFYGLIAFVPKDGALVALLVNAAQGSPPYHQHYPRLAIPKNNVDSSEACDDTYLSGYCAWDLTSQLAVLPVDPGAVSFVSGKRKNPSPWTPSKYPAKQDESLDISWLTAMEENTPDLANINPTCLDHPPTCGKNYRGVTARVDIPSGEVRTCHLSEDFSNPQKPMIHTFQFVERDSKRHARTATHAIADGIGVRTYTSGPLEVQLIKDFTGSVKTIKLKAVNNAVSILILNMPPKMMGTVQDLYSYDFSLLYDLTVPGPSLRGNDRFIPLRLDDGTLSTGLQPSDCVSNVMVDLAVGTQHPHPNSPSYRPICPMAVFSQ